MGTRQYRAEFDVIKPDIAVALSILSHNNVTWPDIAVCTIITDNADVINAQYHIVNCNNVAYDDVINHVLQ